MDWSPPPKEDDNLVSSHNVSMNSSIPEVGYTFGGDVPLNYFRGHVLRVAICTLVLGLLCIYTTPILSILLIPSSLFVLWWVWDALRFEQGGDFGSCNNRLSAITLYLVTVGVSAVIAVINIIFQTKSMIAGEATHTNRKHSDETAESQAGITPAHWVLVIVNAVVFLVCMYGLFCTSKLRDHVMHV